MRRREQRLIAFDLLQKRHGLAEVASIKQDQRLVGENGSRFGIQPRGFLDFAKSAAKVPERHQKRRVPVMCRRIPRLERDGASELPAGGGDVAPPIEVGKSERRMRVREGWIQLY